MAICRSFFYRRNQSHCMARFTLDGQNIAGGQETAICLCICIMDYTKLFYISPQKDQETITIIHKSVDMTRNYHNHKPSRIANK